MFGIPFNAVLVTTLCTKFMESASESACVYNLLYTCCCVCVFVITTCVQHIARNCEFV